MSGAPRMEEAGMPAGVLRKRMWAALAALVVVWAGAWVGADDATTDDTPNSEFPPNWSLLYQNTSKAKLFTDPSTTPHDEDDYSDDIKQPRVLFAQGRYMMFEFPNRKDCTLLKFKEQYSASDIRIKSCTGSERLDWWWFAPFVGGTDHHIDVYNLADSKLTDVDFHSLPDKPPLVIGVDVTSGAGWISLKAKVAPEDLPNLVGVEVRYRTNNPDTFWWRSYVENVAYTGTHPFVRPSHPCPEYKQDGTLCLIISDGLTPFRPGQKNITYNITVRTFRVQPFNRSFGDEMKITYVMNYCDWEKESCWPLSGTLDLDYQIDTDDDYSTTTSSSNNTTTNIHSTSTPWRFDISTTLSPDWFLQNNSKPGPPIEYDDDDLWIIFLALLIILLSIAIPLGIWAGARAGEKEATRHWAALSSSAGNVNIPLGYVATEWDDATRPRI